MKILGVLISQKTLAGTIPFQPNKFLKNFISKWGESLGIFLLDHCAKRPHSIFCVALMVAFWLQSTYTYPSLCQPLLICLNLPTEFIALYPCLPSLFLKKQTCPPLPAQCGSSLVQKTPLFWFYEMFITSMF